MSTESKLSASSARSVACVLRAVELRCTLTGERPSIELLPSQMCLRAMNLARNTAQRELSAVRFLIREMISDDFGEHIGKVFEEFPWLKNSNLAELQKADDLAARRIKQMKADGADVIARVRSLDTGLDLGDLNDEELTRRLSGVRGERPDKVVNKGNTSLLHRDYLRIIMDLSEHDAEEDMKHFVKTNEIRPGVCKAVIGALYLLGMRPVEMWSSVLYVANAEMTVRPELKELVKISPLMALDEDEMVDVTKEAVRIGSTMGVAATRSARETGIPPIVAIRSAKQTNANSDLKVPVRVLSLDGVTLRDASIVAAACLLRFTSAEQKDMDRVRAATIAVIRSIATKYPDMRQDLNLYTFRHSFVTRSRMFLPPAESAAMTGHTSSVTLSGYGEKKVRRSSGWMPKPDPMRAEQLAEAWAATEADKDLKNDLLVSPESDIEVDEDMLDMQLTEGTDELHQVSTRNADL